MAEGCSAGLDWCAGGHRCQPILREHRSHPITVRTRYGALIVTRVRLRGRDRMELRALVDLPADQDRARRMAGWVLVAAHRAIRRMVAGARA